MLYVGWCIVFNWVIFLLLRYFLTIVVYMCLYLFVVYGVRISVDVGSGYLRLGSKLLTDGWNYERSTPTQGDFVVENRCR